MSKMLKTLSLSLAVMCAVSVNVFTKDVYAALYSDKELNLSLDYNDSSKMEFSNGWSNGNPFNCTWRNSNITFNDGKMNLIINKDNQGSSTPYSGAEYRSRDFFSYGMFETSMKPIRNNGVVSSFFTYTGPSDNNPWDEIDIEFLGKDTTKVQFNYYTSGVGNHEYMYDLGFDASQSFHTYGFLWKQDSITWYVDGKEVYKATNNIPKTPGKIMMNVWPGIGVDGWLNSYDGKTPLTAQYDFVSYKNEQALGDEIGKAALLGDVNNDGTVNIKDYLTVQKYLLNSNISINKANADMNEDDAIDVTDALLLKNKLMN